MSLSLWETSARASVKGLVTDGTKEKYKTTSVRGAIFSAFFVAKKRHPGDIGHSQCLCQARLIAHKRGASQAAKGQTHHPPLYWRPSVTHALDPPLTGPPFAPLASQRANWRAVCFLREESLCSKTEERKSKDKAGWDRMDGWCWLTERQWEGKKEGENVSARGDKRSWNAPPTSSVCPTDWVFIVTLVIWKREAFGGHSHALSRVTNAN